MEEQTLGARIAAHRKRLSLTQEALGEKLGVSRQAIYKWEQDAAVPEIDKLISLSRLFGVSLGSLLGLEESAQSEAETVSMTEPQLEALVQRLTPPRRHWKRWQIALLVCAALALVLLLGNLYAKLNRLSSRYNEVSNQLNQVNSNVANVSGQILGITNQVRDALREQSELLTDYSAEPLDWDLRAGTVTFSVQATPRMLTEQTMLSFLVDSDGELTEAQAQRDETGIFRASVTCPLSDTIRMSIVLEEDGVRQTQKLDYASFYDLKAASMPEIAADEYFYGYRDIVVPGVAGSIRGCYGSIRFGAYDSAASAAAIPAYQKEVGMEPVTIQSQRLGIFVNRKLLRWGTPCEKPASFLGDWGSAQFYEFETDALPEDLADGDEICVAAVIHDSADRELVIVTSTPFVAIRQRNGFLLDYAEKYEYGVQSGDWEY